MTVNGGAMVRREALALLLERRSVVANKLGPPGPDRAMLETILRAAARVPDHKKLVPWRFIVFEGAQRRAFGERLAEILAQEESEPPSPMRLETEAGRFERAPVVVAVISRAKGRPAVPEWEQILSAGAACQNLLLAANASGFAGQWITEWPAYSEGVRALLGLAPHERVAGFIYIGTPREKPQERARPELAEIVSYWQPPPGTARDTGAHSG